MIAILASDTTTKIELKVQIVAAFFDFFRELLKGNGFHCEYYFDIMNSAHFKTEGNMA